MNKNSEVYGQNQAMAVTPNFLVIPGKVYGLLEQGGHQHLPCKGLA